MDIPFVNHIMRLGIHPDRPACPTIGSHSSIRSAGITSQNARASLVYTLTPSFCRCVGILRFARVASSG
jgi:hypothetical protein